MSKRTYRSSSDYRGSRGSNRKDPRGRNLYDDLANNKKEKEEAALYLPPEKEVIEKIYGVYEYYESTDAEKPYYVGEGHIPDRVYNKHKPTKRMIECKERFSDTIQSLIDRGNIVPTDRSLVRIVASGMTKMEGVIEETRRIQRYGRAVMLLPNNSSSLLNSNGGLSDYMVSKLLCNDGEEMKLADAAYVFYRRKEKKSYQLDDDESIGIMMGSYHYDILCSPQYLEEQARKKKKKK